MVTVDTHIHASPYWYEPVEVLLFQMDRNNVDRAVLVQIFGQTDNQYIIECARRFPGRFAPVVLIDTDLTDAPETLKQLVKEGVEGIRLRTTTRSPGNDPLAIWHTCAELRLPVTCAGREAEFASDEFRRLVEALPDVPIILEHLGGRPPLDEPPPYTTFRRVLSLANYPNTYIKIGGLGEICQRPYPFCQPFPFDPVPPFFQMVYEAFGPSRMMWGSNYPPSSQLEGYSNTLRYLKEHLANFCREEDNEWIFGKTALSLYQFQWGRAG